MTFAATILVRWRCRAADRRWRAGHTRRGADLAGRGDLALRWWYPRPPPYPS